MFFFVKFLQHKQVFVKFKAISLQPINGGKRQGVINHSSAGTDFSRQNLTSLDVRFWRLKSVPALKG